MARHETTEQFAASLLNAALGAQAGGVAVVKSGANNIKNGARKNVQQSAPVHNAGAHRAITYDEPTVSLFRIESEVGYDRDLPGGALGNLLEYGGGGDKSPAHRDIGRAADAEEPRFLEAAETLALKLL